jgi:tetratricopeptide (TPR) repeat protein
MYQRDYLMRQIEQAAQALARLLRRAAGGDVEGALAMLDQAYQPLLGVGARVVAGLTEEQLISLLTSGSTPDLRRVASVLEVVVAEADLHGRAGRAAQAAARWRRALALAGFLAARSDDLLDADLAATLAERAGDLNLTVAQRLALVSVQESLGRYADAEDTLFEAVEADPDDPVPVTEGIAFYQRLLAVDRARLLAGGLPPDEVRASLAELASRRPAVTTDGEPW